MNYLIREMQKHEYTLLNDFLYEAIFQRDEKHLAPRTIINDPALQVYIKDFGTMKDDYCLCAEVEKKGGVILIGQLCDDGGAASICASSSVAVPDQYCLSRRNDTSRKRTGGTVPSASCCCPLRSTSSQLHSRKRRVNS